MPYDVTTCLAIIKITENRQVVMFSTSFLCSRDDVTIITHKGLFRYTIRFGSGAVYLPKNPVVCASWYITGVHFLDDILVTGRTQDEQVANLRFVLKRLVEAGLKLNNEKCLFFKPSVEYLGH